jgi:hypothetical protein
MVSFFARFRRLLAAVFVLAVLSAVWLSHLTSAAAQRQGQGAQPPQSQGKGGPEAVALDDHTGFESIFDGKTLKDWDGDPGFWRVENETIVGETSFDKALKSNTFLIWRGGQPNDFELKLEYRLNSTNSGVQYRSVVLPEAGKWVLKGYQYDIDAGNRYTGQLYEERGRGFLAMRGQSTHLREDQRPGIIASLGDSEQLKEFIKANDWNQVHIIARGNLLIHILNGHVMSMAIDDDSAKRALGGWLGMQLHVGAPMKIEFRNLWFKKL